jgi:hypothetical protein
MEEGEENFGNPEPQEEADYLANQAWEEEQKYQAGMSAQANMEAEAEYDQMMFDIDKLTNLSKAIDDLEGVKIPFNIIKENIIPLKEWLKETLPKIPPLVGLDIKPKE